MSTCRRILAALLLPMTMLPAALAQEPPADWIEPGTGHRVIRLTGAGGGSSFYFHQNGLTANGDKLVVSVPGGLAAIDLTTLGAQPTKMELIVKGTAKSPIVGKTSRQVFYVQGKSIYGTHLDTKETRVITELPDGYTGASGLAVNANETLLASTGNDPKARKLSQDAGKESPPPQEKKGKNFAPGNRSMVLFTVDIKSGAINRIHYATDWLNHTQFSPNDPGQLLFCHEGTWDLVDRIWTIRTDGTGLKKMHNRAMDREIFGHEFFGSDGRAVWYDLQTPRSTVFWLAGVNIASGDRIRYPLEREQWSVHYNQSPDGRLFAGDGGGPKSVANRTLHGSPPKGGNGQWIWLFTPTSHPPSAIKVGGEDVKVGDLTAEKLVDLKNHNYNLEPNVFFTRDSKWIVFRSNMHGRTHVYAVEVEKSKTARRAGK
jgi:oligogalacturonide lyase